MKNMKKLSLLQKSASLTKAAISPWGMIPDNTGPNPILRLSGGSSKPSKPAVPAKLPPKLNRNSVKVGNLFNFDNLIEPTAIHVGEYIRKHYPPTPDGVPFRKILPIDNSNGLLDDINAHTDLLNSSGSYPEELSHLSPGAAATLLRTMSPKLPIYLIAGRDGANWLWSRRGLKLTDEMWDRMNKARQDPTSQLHKIPLNVYYAYSDNDAFGTEAYSMRFNIDPNKNNLHFNVFNPELGDYPYYFHGYYNGFKVADKVGLSFTPWERFLNFLDVKDHELSHAVNDTSNDTAFWLDDSEWVGEGENKSLKNRMFFRRTNNPELPYYDDATTNKRYQAFKLLFNNTYLENPSEYIGAMARVKRYGAELGFDTTSPDPAKARAAMAQTLHYLATHPKPGELSWELKRIYSWLDTAAINHMLKNNKQNEELELIEANKANYIKDPKSPFYRDVLDIMTDATIQGLVRNATPSNNTMALNNLRYNYA